MEEVQMTRTSSVGLKTSLSTKELGDTFKTETRRMYGIGGKFGHLIGARCAFRYYQPGKDEFARLDDDPATFEVGVEIPTFSYGNHARVSLHMYVWERRDRREVQLVAFHGMVSGAGKSRRRLDRLARVIQSRDQSATLVAA